jgi:hypothetical protein
VAFYDRMPALGGRVLPRGRRLRAPTSGVSAPAGRSPSDVTSMLRHVSSVTPHDAQLHGWRVDLLLRWYTVLCTPPQPQFVAVLVGFPQARPLGVRGGSKAQRPRSVFARSHQTGRYGRLQDSTYPNAPTWIWNDASVPLRYPTLPTSALLSVTGDVSIHPRRADRHEHHSPVC